LRTVKGALTVGQFLSVAATYASCRNP